MARQVTPTQLAADLAALPRGVQERVHGVVVAWTAELERRVKRNASGRPGPNVVTGNYRRSINRQVARVPTGSVGRVSTNAPQGMRLEMGFHGTDSLGRRYQQPAFPHFGPALDEVQPLFLDAVAKAARPEDD